MKEFRPEFESRLLADRWSRCVDYGSPITAWTPEMLRAKREQDERANSEGNQTPYKEAV